MREGDLVTNEKADHNNSSVYSTRCEARLIRIVARDEHTRLNKAYSANGKGDVYVDVVLATEGGPISCGHYLASVFEVIK